MPVRALALLCSILLAQPSSGEERQVRLPDGRALAFTCAGRGPVTVVLEAGWAADARAWGRVLAPVAARTRVCAYDRAGAGRSAPGPMPRTGGAIARDLADGLIALGEEGPILPVGHSIGALYARFLAARLGPRAVGLLLLDPTSFPADVSPFVARARGCLEAPASPGCAVRPPADPRAAWAARASELESLVPPPPLPAVPVLVLVATRGLPEAAAAARVAAVSEPGASVIALADSGHMVMQDRPDAVLAAIEALLPSAVSGGDTMAPSPQANGQGVRP